MLVILEVMLPGMDGEDILRELRKVADVPTLMLMPREEEIYRVPGLSLGDRRLRSPAQEAIHGLHTDPVVGMLLGNLWSKWRF